VTTADSAVSGTAADRAGARRSDRGLPYFSVPATGIEDLNDPIRKWPFNDPDHNLFAVLNLAVGGSGGGDPASGSYPAEMLIDWVRVF
ncbi:MAG: hypothetical protein WAK42_00110, partial [Mycobacterium sp.]